MTITISVWMLIPAALILGAVWMFVVSERETGMFGGIFPAMVGLALLAMAGVFFLGRWLA